MILRSIKLHNIRSYLDGNVEFPESSVLLSGDIGSGKSTILHAIEFALFGILKGEVEGSSLLRHGKKDGFVELKFSVNGRECLIKRALKRSKPGIQQDTGYIIINGLKKEGSAVELKAQVLELLGYPRELLTKSKNLIYRFTVYTPQEEMRQILSEDKELRLDTLRKVFGIDRYKRIRENSLVYMRALKEKVREMEGKVFDIEEKRQQRSSHESELKALGNSVDELKPRLKAAKDMLERKRKELAEYEGRIRRLNELKSELSAQEARLAEKVGQSASSKRELDALEKRVDELKKELVGKRINEGGFRKAVSEKQKEASLVEKDLVEIRGRISSLSSRTAESKAAKKRVSEIDKCPTCMQDVKDEHKRRIIEAESRKVSECEEEIKLCSAQLAEAEKKLRQLKAEIEQLQSAESENGVLRIRFEGLKERIEQKNRILQELDVIKRDIGAINSAKIRAREELEGLKDVEELYSCSRKEIEQLMQAEKLLEIEMAELGSQQQAIARIIERLDSEIAEKQRVQQQIKRINELNNWLESYFINLMVVIEKQVMAKVYAEFNELFQSWFDVLVEDELASARLDDEFTPVIEQNGYETSISNLSGGERTSCALAYRLALNKVVNDIVSSIKTKDIIILDEPTDGFSTEQLDKVRDVLEQLNTRQVIIVSHESKIESFVDNVIRVRKKEHVSAVG